MPGGQVVVTVSDTLVLDAGWWEETLEETVSGTLLPCRLIHPPTPTMYEQVLHFLTTLLATQSAPPRSRLNFADVGLATIALCLRWGTYFAVLADRTKPLWVQTAQTEISMLSDPEMARINIEASAALAQWIDLMRTDDRRFRQLVAAAQTLPMLPPRLDEQTNYQMYRAMSSLNSASSRQYFFALLKERYGDEWFARRQAQIAPNPSRALANGLIDACWRNGSEIEQIHAGQWAARPLQQRRITCTQESAIVLQVGEGMIPAMHAIYTTVRKKSEDSWEEQGLSLALNFSSPGSWSLSAQTAEVLLEGPEP
jgi:hypothetical protein